MRTAILASLVVTVATAACSGASQPSEGVVDMAAARASVDEVEATVAAMSAMNADDAVVAITSLMAAHQLVVTSQGSSDLSLAGRVQPYPTWPLLPPAVGLATCTATSCTFTRYGVSFTYNAFFIDGTVTRIGDLLAFNLTYQADQHALVMTWTLEGSISIAAARLDGNAHLHGVGSDWIEGSSWFAGVSWDVTVDYQAIPLDPQGCPTGGSLHVFTQYRAPEASPGDVRTPGFDLQGSAAFGPGCR